MKTLAALGCLNWLGDNRLELRCPVHRAGLHLASRSPFPHGLLDPMQNEANLVPPLLLHGRFQPLALPGREENVSILHGQEGRGSRRVTGEGAAVKVREGEADGGD